LDYATLDQGDGMKVGDLVTLSSYALQTNDLRRWSRHIWIEKKALVGLVIKIEPEPKVYSWTSVNEKKRYYIKWMQNNGPNGRWARGFRPYDGDAYFLRNDLKFVRSGEFE
jgi:hypothetical protein